MCDPDADLMDMPETTADAPTRTCATCEAPLERQQDWCLECGNAAPGRLAGARPGWRAVITTLALTLVLVGGAGAASYAALSSDANREATASVPGDGSPVAQAPPGVPAPAAPVIPAPVAPKVKIPAPKLPATPKTSEIPTPAPSRTPLPPPSTPAPTKTQPSSTPKATPDPKAEPAPRGQGTSARGGKDQPAATLQPLALGADAVSVYDPYDRAVQPGDTADAYDGDASTSFALTSKDDGQELQVGLVVDLGARKEVGGVELTTGTAGGRVEVYATDSAALPADILDTRWDHPASQPNLGTGTTRIRFPKGGANYRYVTFWFTVPPKSGRTVQVKELKLLG